MKIDSHQHFWRYAPAEYPWIGAGMERLARDMLPDDLAPELSATGIDGTIAVQARQSLEETRWLLDLARSNPRIRGVVGWVDLRSSAVQQQLDGLADESRLVGVRHVVQDEPDPRFLLGANFVRGLERLGPAGLVYDLLVYPHQLPAAVELAGLLPEQPFVLDHLAKPRIREAAIDVWKRDIQPLARHENVSCKLSGLVTEAAWRQWRPQDFRPYLETALEAFGPERLMFGSDWPVCLVAADYAEVVGLCRNFVAGLSAAEQANIWGGTAARVYGIDEAG